MASAGRMYCNFAPGIFGAPSSTSCLSGSSLFERSASCSVGGRSSDSAIAQPGIEGASVIAERRRRGCVHSEPCCRDVSQRE